MKDLELLSKFSIRPHISYVGAQFFHPGVDSDPSMTSIVSSYICGELDVGDWNKPFLSTIFF